MRIAPPAGFLNSAQRTGAPYNSRVAVLGDSITNHATINGGAVWDKVGWRGNRYGAYGVVSWLRVLTNQAFDFDGRSNFGVTGDTLPQILARADAALAASSAGTWMVLGGANDRGAADLTLAESQNALSSIVQKILAAGRIVVLLTPLPAGDASFTSQRYTTTQTRRHIAFCRWILQTYSETPGVYVVNTWPGFALANSTTGDAIVGMHYDGLHPSPLGAFQIAQLCLPVFRKIFAQRLFFPSSNSDQYDAADNPLGCLVANPMMDGTGGTPSTGGSGALATSWSGGNGSETGHTRAYSKVTSNGLDWQQCVIGGTALATADISVALQAVTTNIAANDWVQAACQVEVDGGMTNVNVLRLIFQETSPSFVNLGADMDYSDFGFGTVRGFMPSSSWSGTLMTAPMKITNTTCRLSLQARIASGAVAGSVRFRGLSLFKSAAPV